MPTFAFVLQSFHITDTRSTHKDTDYVCFTLKVGNGGSQSQQRQMHDVNNGEHDVALSFGPMDIQPDTLVTVNYLIYNSQSSPDTVNRVLATLGDRLAEGPIFGLPPFSSSVQIIEEKFADELQSIKKAPCDGVVAAEANFFSFEQLAKVTYGDVGFTESTSHAGIQAGHSCNSKPSAYVVHWHINQLVTVPGVLEKSFEEAKQILQTVGLTGVLGTNKGDRVTKQDPPGGQPANIGSEVTLSTGLSF